MKRNQAGWLIRSNGKVGKSLSFLLLHVLLVHYSSFVTGSFWTGSILEVLVPLPSSPCPLKIDFPIGVTYDCDLTLLYSIVLWLASSVQILQKIKRFIMFQWSRVVNNHSSYLVPKTKFRYCRQRRSVSDPTITIRPISDLLAVNTEPRALLPVPVTTPTTQTMAPSKSMCILQRMGKCLCWHVLVWAETAAQECISDEALAHLKTYKYSSVDKSFISNYILKHYVSSLLV